MRPDLRYTVFTGYVLNDRLSASPGEIQARIRDALPPGCRDFDIRTKEEYTSANDPLMKWGSSPQTFDDRLYFMMRHDPDQVASMVRRLSGHW